jgi:hypothetical protein
MPKFDQHCTACDWSAEIIVRSGEHPPCPSCSGATERWWPIGEKTHGVIGDEIIGGRWVENMGPSPVWVESKSHYRRELAKRGLEEKVRHIGTQDSDKSSHTTRWY